MIPIRNLWLLMLYAGELAPILKKFNKGFDEDRDNLPNLIAEFLCFTVEKRLQKNLSFGYQHRSAEISRVRGKINFLYTESKKLLSKGKVACSFEELTINTPKNRFVLCALDRVSKLVVDDNFLKHRCKELATRFKRLGVDQILPSKSEISLIQVGRNDSDDKAMIAASKLVFHFKLPNEDNAEKFMYSPSGDDNWLRSLFERAVRGFYSHILRDDWKVNDKRWLYWNINYKDDGIDSILPNMQIDIILDNKKLNQRLVIDTKFTSALKEDRFGSEKLKSGYIYQMYSYLMSQINSSDPLDRNSSGIFIHPKIGESLDQTVVIQGHPIRFLTVDLSASTKEIKSQLLKVIDTPKNYH